MEPSYCSFCLQPESFLLIVAGCTPYLNDGLYFWQHNSALSFVAQIVQSKQSAKLYVDLPGYLSPVPFINGDNLRPDILLSTTDHTLYNIELTMGLEINYADLGIIPFLQILSKIAIKRMNLLACAVAALIYLVIHLTHFVKCAMKEALKIVILGLLSISHRK